MPKMFAVGAAGDRIEGICDCAGTNWCRDGLSCVVAHSLTHCCPVPLFSKQTSDARINRFVWGGGVGRLTREVATTKATAALPVCCFKGRWA